MISPEYLSAVANTIMASAAAVAAFVAWQGLDTWRSEITWKENRDLSRRIQQEASSYRYALKHLRTMYHLSTELMREGETTISIASGDPDSIARVRDLYRRRWVRVDNQNEKIYAALFETDSLWGPEFRELWKKVASLETEVSNTLGFYLGWLNRDHEAVSKQYGDEETQQKHFSIIFWNARPGETNEMSDSLDSAFLEVERYLKAKMGGRRS